MQLWLLFLVGLVAAVHGHIQHAIRSGQVVARGVNLGGWLVLERWMTSNAAIWKHVPEALKDAGEFQAMSAVGRAVADPLIKAHREQWITESDIKEIASYGMNLVRVPVGWWIYEKPGETDWQHFTPGGLAYLDKLVNDWAVKYNVAVLIDMHAAKGSQNGREHGAAVVTGQAHFTDNTNNIQRTSETVEFLVNRYKSSPAFLGIELLNEPEWTANQDKGTDRAKLKLYYQTLYARVRAACGDCVIVISPFLTEQGSSHGEWGSVLPFHKNNWIDWHKYLKWGFEGQSLAQITGTGVDNIEKDLREWRGPPIFMGEWSLGHPDSAKADFARSDSAIALFAARQLAALNAAKAGWAFWSWKADYGTKYGDGWSMQSLLRNKLLKLDIPRRKELCT
ncbi:hypothetical protein ACHHYP_10221 [Achlya hypogyna]|uniref:glucan 1,3-beta-glucosidase n=1 Tax=Achlya hypogyna TaxID=1202772 RepID=A0A1V9ZHZ6_ACHHY|nr:hypothetical protein ACHHYP_10221 [Achlya hypogyna]